MCIIIDANVIGKLFEPGLHPESRPVLDWLFDGAGHLVYGGYLRAELERTDAGRRAIRVLVEAGRASEAPVDEVTAETNVLVQGGQCESNDCHIIALAKVTGARILFSDDGALGRDFTNGKFLASPRGEIYKRTEHAHLLRRKELCPHCRKKRRR